MINKKRILLLGGGGFIGRNILEQLSGKYKLVAPGRKELDLLDIERVSAFFNSHYFDVVIYAAGQGVSRSQKQTDGIYETNVKMFLNVVGCQKNFRRMIFLGSGAEYGKQEPIVNVKESDFGKRQPEDEYGRAKYFASEKIAQMNNAVNLRCFGIFGKYEDYTTRFISNAICHAILSRPIIVHQNVKFSYVYVNDLVKIIEYFINHWPKHKFYNIGTGLGVELIELAEMVKAATDSASQIKIINPGFNKEYTCDASLLMQELGDFKFTPFKTAIKEMVEWYKENIDLIDINKLEFNAKQE